MWSSATDVSSGRPSAMSLALRPNSNARLMRGKQRRSCFMQKQSQRSVRPVASITLENVRGEEGVVQMTVQVRQQLELEGDDCQTRKSVIHPLGNNVWTAKTQEDGCADCLAASGTCPSDSCFLADPFKELEQARLALHLGFTGSIGSVRLFSSLKRAAPRGIYPRFIACDLLETTD